MQNPERLEKNKNSPLTSEKEALRAKLQAELQNKKQCSYQSYECTQFSLDGYNYCLKHILNDKNAPFKQCSYVYTSNSKRCPLPAPKCDKKDAGYCNEHALKATLIRSKQNCRYPPPKTAEVLLHSLSHYVKKPRGKNAQQSDELSDEAELKATKSLDPFTEINAVNQLNNLCNNTLDLCSDSDSDIEPSTYATIWHDAQADSSDNDSIDSEQEDCLKHANVYTAEEVTSITREKLVRLQALYIEQYRHLQYLLKEKRRKYLHSLKREKETCCNIYSQVRDNSKEQRLYAKLKAYNKYHRTHGQEAILSKRSHELRAKLNDGGGVKPTNYTKCTFTEGGVKCGERSLPLARHCRKHILEDANQVLFRSCGKVKADVECTTPVEAIFESATCSLHMDIPCLRSYSQPRKDSDSDYDDSLEAANAQSSLMDLSTTSNVKTELIDYKISSDIPRMDTVPALLFEEHVFQDENSFNDSAQNTLIIEKGSNKNELEDFDEDPLAKKTRIEKEDFASEISEGNPTEEENFRDNSRISDDSKMSFDGKCKEESVLNDVDHEKSTESEIGNTVNIQNLREDNNPTNKTDDCDTSDFNLFDNFSNNRIKKEVKMEAVDE